MQQNERKKWNVFLKLSYFYLYPSLHTYDLAPRPTITDTHTHGLGLDTSAGRREFGCVSFHMLPMFTVCEWSQPYPKIGHC